MATYNSIIEDVLNRLGIGEDETGQVLRTAFHAQHDLHLTTNSDGASVYLLRLNGRVIGTVYQSEIGDRWRVSAPDQPQADRFASWQDPQTDLISALASCAKLWLPELLNNSEDTLAPDQVW